MIASVNRDTVLRMFESAAAAMAEHRIELIDLDRGIGDGDLGITMEKGFAATFQAVKEQVALPQAPDPGTLFAKAGMAIIKYAPSTMGTLMGSGFLRGGKAVTGKNELSHKDMTSFLAGFLQGVTDRGKARPGEKTILDVLIPAVNAMEAYAGDDVSEVWAAAAQGATRGEEITKSLESQHGKAAVFREKTRGLIDPGGHAVLLLIESFSKSLQ